MRTHDCKPTLTDSQVIEFCRNGHLMLPGVVPDDVNKQAREFMDEYHAKTGRFQISRLLEEDWFLEQVIRNPEATGAMRSLLGPNYREPEWLAWFRGEGPEPAGQWHIDGCSKWGPQVRTLKWYYIPSEATEDTGPTIFVSGSHLAFNQVRFMAHYDSFRGTYKAIGPAGSIYLTHYSIWHRRAKGRADGVRYMLTGSVDRTAAPARDWVREPDLDFGAVEFGRLEPRFGEQYRAHQDGAHMFLWLCGKGDRFRRPSGPAWPLPPLEGHNYEPPVGILDDV